MPALAVKDFVEETLAFVKQASRVNFRTRQQRRYDLYTGHYVPHIIARLQALCPATWTQFQPIWINLYRKVIDRRAGIFYRDPPTRLFLDGNGQKVSEDVQFLIDQALPGDYFSSIMDKASRYLNSHRTIAVNAVWRHERVEFDVLGPMNFDIVPGYPDPASAEDADAFVHFRGMNATIWTSHEDTLKSAPPSFIVVNEKGKVIQREDNPYFIPGEGNVYPFAVLQDEDPDTDLFIPGGEEIVEAALHVAFALTDDAFIQRFQSFGQPVFIGVPNETARQMVLSPSEGIGLPDPGMDLQFRSPGVPPDQRAAALANFLTVFANSVDLPADVFLPNSAIPESGIAKRIASVPLTEYRQSKARRLALQEQEVFETFRAVYNAHCAREEQIPWDVYLQTQHAPVTLFFDALELDQRNAARVAANLDSWPAILARELGVSIEEAAQILQRNRELNASAGAGQPSGGTGQGTGAGGTGIDVAAMRARMEANRAARASAAKAGGGTGTGASGTGENGAAPDKTKEPAKANE